MTDLVKRLRLQAAHARTNCWCESELKEAADEIERLEARVKALEGICNKAAGAIITKKYKLALAQVMGGVPEAEDK